MLELRVNSQPRSKLSVNAPACALDTRGAPQALLTPMRACINGPRRRFWNLNNKEDPPVADLLIGGDDTGLIAAQKQSAAFIANSALYKHFTKEVDAQRSLTLSAVRR